MNACVYLLGAGPGDPDLITVKGASVLQTAEVIVYDQLANPLLLNYASGDCKRIYVGKEAGHHSMKQEKINELLVELAEKYHRIVRLKGGDPYVFGRGGEEGEALYEAGIDFEVVPGITSAIGGLAYAGIPITSRNIATSFHVVTGHVSNDSAPIQYEHLAKVNGTLVFLMGVGNLTNIVRELLYHGKEATTPVAIIFKASTPDQKVTLGTLETIVKISTAEKIKSPSLIVVGDVVNHRDRLSFFEKRPLFGRHILVTRSRENQSKMTKELMTLGAKVTQLPAIRILEQNIQALDEAILSIHNFQGIIFTSGVAVTLFFRQLKNLRLDARHLYGLKIYVVGRESQKVLEREGIITDLVPDTFSKDGLSKLLKETSKPSDRLLIPRSARGDKAWLDELLITYDVEEIQCYDTLLVEETTVDIHALDSIDYMTFTSASTVHGFNHQREKEGNEKLNLLLKAAKVVAIGPSTRTALEEIGIEVDLQPKTFTVKSMVEVILQDVQTAKEQG